jgi:hypothetical protein
LGGGISTQIPEREVYEWERNSRRVVASHEMGTRMVMDAQIESGTLSSQKRGGPLNVTNILAAVATMVEWHFPLAMAQPR